MIGILEVKQPTPEFPFESESLPATSHATLFEMHVLNLKYKCFKCAYVVTPHRRAAEYARRFGIEMHGVELRYAEAKAGRGTAHACVLAARRAERETGEDSFHFVSTATSAPRPLLTTHIFLPSLHAGHLFATVRSSELVMLRIAEERARITYGDTPNLKQMLGALGNVSWEVIEEERKEIVSMGDYLSIL